MQQEQPNLTCKTCLAVLYSLIYWDKLVPPVWSCCPWLFTHRWCKGWRSGPGSLWGHERRLICEEWPHQSLIHLHSCVNISEISDFCKGDLTLSVAHSCLAPEPLFTSGFLQSSKRCVGTTSPDPAGCGKRPWLVLFWCVQPQPATFPAMLQGCCCPVEMP